MVKERAGQLQNNSDFHILVHAWNRMEQEQEHFIVVAGTGSIHPQPLHRQLSADTLTMATFLSRIKQEW
jgi:hypothetical protein